MHTHQPTDVRGYGPPPAFSQPPDDRRAALYLPSISDGDMHAPALLDCARQARQQGLRVVTLVAEEDGEAVRVGQRSSLGGSRLCALVESLNAGQFDVIVAHTGDAVINIEMATEARNVVVPQ